MIDSHCHLNDENLRLEADEIVSRFLLNGVERVLNIGTDIETSILAREQAKKYDSVYYTIAMYPEYYKNYNEREFEDFLVSCLGENRKRAENTNFDKISLLNTKNNSNNNKIIKNNNKNAENNINLINLDKNNNYLKNNHNNENKYKNNVVLDKFGKNKLLAIGEIGLDYHYGKDDRNEQMCMFESQIKLAKKYNLPIIIHNRDASGDILEILKRNAPYTRGGIIHCFSASLEWAREVIKLGFYISFSGTVTYKNAVNVQEVAKSIPEDRILVETDSPYLSPVPYRGQRNEPKNVVEVANFIANLRGLSYEHINKCTTDNFNRLFGF